MSEIKLVTKSNATVLIPLYDRVSVITGDSASGKTKLFRFLKACQGAPTEVTSATIDLNKMLFIDSQYDLDNFDFDHYEGYMVFIDHFSFLQDSRKLLKFIDESKNTFIIMGHGNVTRLTWQDPVLYLEHDGTNFICKQVFARGLFHPAVVL